MSESRAGEIGRKVVHIGAGFCALLLRILSWPQAAGMAIGAFVFNWQVLPRIGGKGLWRGGEREKGYPLGILLYPLSVLVLILLFRKTLAAAAALWAILAWGDGMASLVGQSVGGPRLPWNPRKGWAGLLAFIVFGACAATLFAAWVERRQPVHGGLLLVVTLACALVETLPTTLDDNLTVPVAGAILLPLLARANPENLLGRPDLLGSVGLGLLANGAIAALAFVAGSIDVLGAVAAILIGTAVVVGLSLPGFALLVAFFVLGSLATRLGYRAKEARGIAQERGGARGWRNALANGGVPAFLALLCALWAPESRGILVLAFAAAVATATADTCSSEIGKAYGRRTFLITTFRPVPPGTEGAVSAEGTLGGLLGAALIGSLGAVVGLFGWGGAFLVTLAGFLGSLGESVVGTVAEKRGWLDNNLLNAFNTALGAALVAFLARLL